MSAADPRCLVCRGSGVVRDTYADRDEVCACTEHEPRKVDAYAPPSPGWVGEALEDALRRSAERHAAAEAHRAECKLPTCERCERYACACGAPAASWSKQCEACWDRDVKGKALEPVRASVPKRFRWAFDATPERLLGRVKVSGELVTRGLANPPGTDLVFTGATGAGKTSLAVAMLDAYARQDPIGRKGARFVEAYTLAGARARHPLGQGEAPAVVDAMQASLLVVDDLGSEVDDRRNVLADVIFHRHNEELPTWITTGFPMEQLMGRYGSQIIRRVFEQSKLVQVGPK